MSRLAPLTRSMFSLTLFLSATLLFLVQPMVSKMLLPLLGGTPAVWNTCMVFFQAVLLAGYLYAHAVTRLRIPLQAIVHALLLLLPLLFLPITVNPHWLLQSASNPVLQLLTLLCVTVGLPFFVVSTSAPLLQRWFWATEHPTAHDPYFLYGASNLGSMVALLGYPVLVEPHLRLVDQSQLWVVGYLTLVVLTLGCAGLMWLSTPAATSAPPGAPGRPWSGAPSATVKPPRLTLGQRVRWVALAFVPSSLMLGTTTYITTDIASIPLLWILPLALYLLSFILVFSRLPQWPNRGMSAAAPLVILMLVFLTISHLTPLFWKFWMTILLHLAVLFVVSMVCHGEVARSRPPASQLTLFYLCLALGGVFGGLFNALLAPTLFSTVAEYPLVVVMSCLLLPRHRGASFPWSRWLDVGVPVALGVLTLGLLSEVLVFTLHPNQLSTLLHLEPDQLNDFATQWLRFDLDKLNIFLKYGVPVVLCSLCTAWPVRFGLSVGALLLVSTLWGNTDRDILYRERSFFGVLRVERTGTQHRLLHGTTLHGVQSRDPLRRHEPLTYYHRTGPIGQVFETFEGTAIRQHVAVVGLGTGTLACYGELGHTFTFYEIDPAVSSIASEPRYFTYLQDGQERGVAVQVVLGDARLQIATAPDRHYGLIIIDAFSSDAIPVHLITREALELYFSNLAEGGLVALHISNRHLNLAPVLGNLAQATHLVGLVQQDRGDETIGKLSSEWVILARYREDFGKLAEDTERWKPLEGRPDVGIWTDDFSNLLSVFQWQK